MKVAVVFTGLGVLPERRNNVSGHVQIPLKTCELLQQAGHDVTLISTCQEDGKAMPTCLPDGISVKIVVDGRRRGQFGKQNYKSGYKPLQLIQQVRETLKYIRECNAEIVHVFGFERMVKFSGVLKLLSRKPVVVTLLGQKPSGKWNWLYRRIDQILCLTKSVASNWSAFGDKVRVIYPGVVKDLSDPEAGPIPPKKDRVLFWREASMLGGADLCMKAYAELAPRFPDIKFEFAVRRNKDEVPGLDDLAAQHDNINVHRFPYQDGVSLEGLVARSLVTVLPYRQLTIEPQLAVVETLSVGCPVICTDIKCLPELVLDGANGWTVPSEDEQSLTAAIENALSKPEMLAEMQKSIASDFNQRWNWEKYGSRVQETYREHIH